MKVEWKTIYDWCINFVIAGLVVSFFAYHAGLNWQPSVEFTAIAALLAIATKEAGK